MGDLTTLRRQRCAACELTSYELTCFLCGAPMVNDVALTVIEVTVAEPVESNRQRQARRLAE